MVDLMFVPWQLVALILTLVIVLAGVVAYKVVELTSARHDFTAAVDRLLD